MKKFTKVCLIIAAVCMALGIGLTTVAGFSGVRLRDLPVITYRSSCLLYTSDAADEL